MAKVRVTPTTEDLIRRGAAAEYFMVCPLCTAVNVRANEECFVCRWAGDFDYNPAAIEMALHEIRRQYPEMMEAARERRPLPVKILWNVFTSWLASRRRRSLDIKV